MIGCDGDWVSQHCVDRGGKQTAKHATRLGRFVGFTGWAIIGITIVFVDAGKAFGC